MRSVVRHAAAAVVLTFAAFAAHAQTDTPSVDTLIAKNLAAKGGEAKLKAISSMKMTGKVTIQGMEVPMVIVAMRPNLMRQEMQIQDKRIVSAFDGERAWMINPFMGSDTAQEIHGPQADMAKDQADFDGALVDYKAKGHTAELAGSEDFQGRKVHKLKVTKKGGHVQYFFLDAESGIELKMSTQIQQGGNTVTVDTELSDYQPVQGIMVPHTLKTSINGQPTGQISVEKVEMNVAVDEAQFKMPKP